MTDKETTAEDQHEQVTFDVEGMNCTSCESAIQEALRGTPGVDQADVRFATETARVTYNPDRIDRSDLVDVIQSTGYNVRSDGEETTILTVDDMHCASCVSTVEETLNKKEGVRRVNVNLGADEVTITHGPDVSVDVLTASLDSAGYPARLKTRETLEDDRAREVEKMNRAWRQMVLAWGFTVPVMLWMIPHMLFPSWMESSLIGGNVYEVGIVFLSAIAVLWPGFETLKSAWKSSLNLNPNMDVLIGLGSGASLLTGLTIVFILASGGEPAIANYAGIGAMIMAFHLTGRYVENKARGEASQAIKKLLQLQPDTARVEREGEEQEIPVNQLEPGDVMSIRPGEKIPTDGEVIEGTSTVDESMATGESMPVKREEGDEVIGSTINQEGHLRVKVTKVGEDTFLSQVVELVRQAQGSKVPIQQLADRITGKFVPVVLGLALVTLAAWLVFPDTLQPLTVWAADFLPWVNPNLGTLSQALFASIAVLVIACPCALGLATPTALMVGTGMGAQEGIIIRSGEAIQISRNLDVVVLDKTGTLTEGEPSLTDIITSGSVEEERLLSYTAALESRSEHHIAKAILEGAKNRGAPVPDDQVTDFQSITGQGVEGDVEGTHVLVGNRELLSQKEIDLPEHLKSKANDLSSEGKTPMFVVFDGNMEGVIAVADTLKEGAKETVANLHEMGLEIAMLTGDTERTAQAIADQLNIDRVMAEVLPDEKTAEIRRLQQEQNLTVAMVGDGINDAPALKQAHVGIAIGTGTDIAIESADITLVKGDLDGIRKCITLSRATFTKIRQNLFWAFIYNILALPIAMAGFLHPVIAEIAMATSSVSVVTNANFLKRTDLS